MKVVGVLGDATGDPYSLRLMQAAAGEIVKAGCHAICFLGGFPQAPVYRDASDRPALPNAVDGWVLLSTPLRDSASELADVAAASGRCVSIGLELAGTPSFTASDEAGIFQAVAHLARRHERRRIAFVGGPSTSAEAVRRLEGYRMALESVGLRVDPALIATGDYESRSGREAVRLLQRQAKSYDAVVAANDLMAIGVIEGLRANGQRSPEDVSVIGFDDMEEASFAAPALTTVRQPLQEMGSAAARLALARIAGTAVEPHTVVTAPLVIRRSCGCAESDGPERRPASSLGPATDPKAAQGLREGVLKELVRRELASSRMQRELARLGEGILGTSDYPELAPWLAHVCRLLNLRRLVLSTYRSASRQARVTLESSSDSVVFHQGVQPYPLEQIFPPAFLRADRPLQLALLPLELAGEQFGYLLLDGEVRDAHAYIALRRSLSSSLARMAQGRELRRLYAAEKRRG